VTITATKISLVTALLLLGLILMMSHTEAKMKGTKMPVYASVSSYIQNTEEYDSYQHAECKLSGPFRLVLAVCEEARMNATILRTARKEWPKAQRSFS
jgi:hypothetical protein